MDIAADRHQIEDRGGEVADRAALLMRDVAAHGQRLQVDLRRHDRRAEAEHHAAFQPLHRAREDQEIAIAGRAQRRAVAIRMLVQDVVADARMHRDRHGSR